MGQWLKVHFTSQDATVSFSTGWWLLWQCNSFKTFFFFFFFFLTIWFQGALCVHSCTHNSFGELPPSRLHCKYFELICFCGNLLYSFCVQLKEFTGGYLILFRGSCLFVGLVFLFLFLLFFAFSFKQVSCFSVVSSSLTKWLGGRGHVIYCMFPVCYVAHEKVSGNTCCWTNDQINENLLR